jgi:hypothetical protein
MGAVESNWITICGLMKGCWVIVNIHHDSRIQIDFFFVAKIQIDVTAYTSRQHYNDKVMIKHKGCFI